MKQIVKTTVLLLLFLPVFVVAQKDPGKVDWEMVAKIREEGFQRSQVVDIVGYMTDVLGFRCPRG